MKMVWLLVVAASAAGAQSASSGGWHLNGAGGPGIGGPTSPCGPPAYLCSRSDLLPAPNPAIPPQVGPNTCVAGNLGSCGNLSGANSVVVDPDFSNRIARLTDANTSGGSTIISDSSGSDDVNIWNTDSTYLVVTDLGSGRILFAFNPSTMQGSACATLPSAGYAWSYTQNKVLYSAKGTQLLKYDFTGYSCGNPAPTPTVIEDFDSATCLQLDPNWVRPAQLGQINRSQFAVAKDGSETMFEGLGDCTGAGQPVAACNSTSPITGQGSGFFEMVLKPGSGCRFLDSASGQIYGEWGPTGTIVGTPDRWTFHEVLGPKSGSWEILGYTKCLSGTCDGVHVPYFWNVSTLNVSQPSGALSGHFTEGFGHWYNVSGTPHIGQEDIRAFTALTSPTSVITAFPVGMVTPFDNHYSWNNVDSNDTYPVFHATWTPAPSQGAALPAAWYNEVLATFPATIGTTSAGTVKRFAHSFITGSNVRFNTQYAIGSVSQDGRFFALSSDWLGTLGAETGTAACGVIPFTTAAGILNWAALHSYVLNAGVRPVTGNPLLHQFQATTAGTSGASPPTWPQTIGQTVLDGLVTWTDVGPACRGDVFIVELD